jgi:voltage-gated sodium channel
LVDEGIWQDPLPPSWDDRGKKVTDVPPLKDTLIRETTPTEIPLRVLEEPCTSRWPAVGDMVKYARNERYKQKNGWVLERGAVAVVTRVDKEGDFKLQNPDGIESTAWNYRKFFVYYREVASEPVEGKLSSAKVEEEWKSRELQLQRSKEEQPCERLSSPTPRRLDPGDQTLQNLVEDLDHVGYTPVPEEDPVDVIGSNLPPPIAQAIQWYRGLVEPERTGPLAEVVQGQAFELICTTIIIMNAVMTFFSTNYNVANPGETSPVYTALEVAFSIWYAMELSLKLAVHKMYFFCNENHHWNMFDFFLVCTSIYDQLSASLSADEHSGVGLVFLRTLRLLKMARVLRMFRLIRALAVLRLILNSILGSLPSLFWSIVMMMLIFYMFGLVFVQNTAEHLSANEGLLSSTELRDLQRAFGSVQKAMLSLFMATTGGDDWSKFYAMLEPIGIVTCWVYLFFVSFTQIALMNILTGIFVENAMKLAEPDRQALFSQQQKERLKQVKELESIMREVDQDSTGHITSDEFHQEMRNTRGKLRTYLGSMGIHEGDAERFFMMLQTAHQGQPVANNLFVAGCLRLQGGAQSLDLQAVVSELNILHHDIRDIKKALRTFTFTV